MVYDNIRNTVIEEVSKSRDNQINLISGSLQSSSEFVSDDGITFKTFTEVQINGILTQTYPKKGFLLFAKHHKDPYFLPIGGQKIGGTFELLSYLKDVSNLLNNVLNVLAGISYQPGATSLLGTITPIQEQLGELINEIPN